jgi:OOP family OmpA-OmpF porin
MTRLAFGVLGFAGLGLLTCCVGTSALSRMDQARPIGGPFSQALFKNYAALAHSFGEVGTPSSGTPFDAAQSISLGSMSSGVADIANTYAQKALDTSQGDEILPEDPDSSLRDSDTLRLELLRDLDQGRDRAPQQAARAQADYDCWIVNARSGELRRASLQCRRSLAVTLAQLERDLAAAAPRGAPSQPPEQASAPAAPPTPAGQTAPPTSAETPPAAPVP